MCFFFFHAPATTARYTLSLHDALPIFAELVRRLSRLDRRCAAARDAREGEHRRLPERQRARSVEHHLLDDALRLARSEEHTSELQSRLHLVCRLLLEKKKQFNSYSFTC